MPGPDDNPDARQRWFLERRSGPDGKISAGAYLKALQEKHRLRQETARPLVEPTAGGVNWTPLGPAAINHGQATLFPIVSGRIAALAVGPGGQRIYAGAANGGVWFSADAGSTWTPLDQWEHTSGVPSGVMADSLSVGALAVLFGTASDGSADTIFVGTGEPGGGGGYFGIGVKSLTPGQKAFSNEAANLSGKAIYQLVIDPAQPATVFAATSAGLFQRPATAPFDSWTAITVVDGQPATPVSEIVLPARGPKAFYAACPGFGIYFSPDGSQWTLIGAYPGAFVRAKRIALAASESDPPVLYALTNNGNLYRMDIPNGGEFSRVLGLPPIADLLGTQGTYDLVVAVDPGNPDTIYLGGSTVEDEEGVWSASLYKGTVVFVPAGLPYKFIFPFDPANSKDVWKDPTWIGDNVHADVHALVFATNPDNNTHDRTIVWVGTDGGPFASSKSGRRSSFISRSTGLSITQLNYLAQREDTDAVLYAGCQDNGTIRYWGEPAWFESPQGDGGGIAVDPNNPLRVMRQYIYASLWTSVNGGLTATSWTPASGPLNTTRSVEALRSSFYAPVRAFAVDSNHTSAVFGTNRLWLTTDWGQSWSTLPSLTDGSDLTADVLDDPGFLSQPYNTNAPKSYIKAIWVASPALIYVATVRGLWKFVQDAAGKWSKAAVPDTNSFLPINCIGGASNDMGNFYVGSGTWGGSSVQYFQHTVVGQTAGWIDVQFPAAVPVSCLVVDPDDPNAIYVGTEVGVWKGVRSDSGIPGNYVWAWTLFSDGLPEAAVLDLIIHEGARLLRAATYGRGAWEISISSSTPRDPDIYVRTDYADSGRINPATNKRYPWIDGVPDPTQPAPAQVTHTESADLKVQPASDMALPLPLSFAQYANLAGDGLPDVVGTNQLFVQVHNRSSVGTNPAVTVNVLVLVADASASIPQLPPGYASNIAMPNPSPSWLANGWKFADPDQPFRTATIPSSRLSVVVEYDLALLPLGLGAATKLCAALFISAPGDALATTELNLDALTLGEKKVAYRIFDVARGSWDVTGTMQYPRTWHSATRLASTTGKILVTGGLLGVESRTATNIVQLYDPVKGSWSSAKSMNNARAGHTATLLDDGRVLVAGGWYQDPTGPLNAAEVYDPRADAWTVVPVLHTARTNHCAVLLKNGKVLVAGGYPIGGNATNSTEFFDPASGPLGDWTPGANLQRYRNPARAVRFPDGSVVVVSPVLSYPDPSVTSSEISDSSGNNWGNLATLGVTVWDGFTLTLLANGKVLRVGGDLQFGSGSPRTPTAELFDRSHNSWAMAAPMKSARAYHTAVQIAANVVMVVGGLMSNSSSPAVEFYDALRDTWIAGAAPNHAGSLATLTRLADGTVLLAGGYALAPNAVLFTP